MCIYLSPFTGYAIAINVPSNLQLSASYTEPIIEGGCWRFITGYFCLNCHLLPLKMTYKSTNNGRRSMGHSRLLFMISRLLYILLKALPTVKKTASIASRNARTTFIFFSLNFSKMADAIIGTYGANFVRSPLAKPCTHLAAMATTTTLLSFDIT